MKRLLILSVVLSVALLGCKTMDDGMGKDADEDMKSEQMEEGMEKDESMDSDSM